MATEAKVETQHRAMRVFVKCAQSALYLADCHPRYVAASRRMLALRDAYQLDTHPQWTAIARAVRAQRSAAVRGL
jgi:hypothetical protein